MEVAFLGTNSALPKKDRNVSSLLIRPAQRSELILVDCGEGTQHQLVKFPKYSLAKIRMILITHLHGDHCFGLPGLLCTLSGQISHSTAGEIEVLIVGPKGIRKMLHTMLSISGSYLTFKLNICELIPPRNESEEESEGEEEEESQYDLPFFNKYRRIERDSESRTYNIGTTFFSIPSSASSKTSMNNTKFKETKKKKKKKKTNVKSGGEYNCKLRAYEINHRMFCVGYIFEEANGEGKFSSEKLYEECGIYFGKVSLEFQEKHKLGKFDFREFSKNFPNVPRNFIRILKEGKDVHYETKEKELKVIEVSKVLEPGVRGKKYIILGDCFDADPNNILEKEFGKKSNEENYYGVDLLVHECTFENKLEKDAIEKGHATPNIVTTLCNKIFPKLCVINHFSPRYENDKEKEKNVFQLLDECKEKYENVELAEDFKVITL